MNASFGARVYGRPRADLRAIEGGAPAGKAAYWRINGHRARLLIWTRDEWEKLKTRPPDAQFHPSGVWCALRLD
jgi:hypothetical protein